MNPLQKQEAETSKKGKGWQWPNRQCPVSDPFAQPSLVGAIFAGAQSSSFQLFTVIKQTDNEVLSLGLNLAKR